jgi:ArsR family transcriptional regulator
MSVTALDLRPLSRLYKALGDETRLRIVALLSHGELCVCHVEGALEIPQPTASRHLAVLRNAGVVEARREGTWIYYRLAAGLDTTAQHQLRALVREFGKRADLKQDVARLLRSRGPGACK